MYNDYRKLKMTLLNCFTEAVKLNVLEVYKRLDENGVVMLPCSMEKIKGITVEVNGKYGVAINHKEMENSNEEFIVAAHEYGHCMTGTTYSFDTDEVIKRKCEYKADRRAILDFLPIEKFKEAIKNGCQMAYEFAEYLDLPEKFVIQAYEHYKAMGLL